MVSNDLILDVDVAWVKKLRLFNPSTVKKQHPGRGKDLIGCEIVNQAH